MAKIVRKKQYRVTDLICASFYCMLSSGRVSGKGVDNGSGLLLQIFFWLIGNKVWARISSYVVKKRINGQLLSSTVFNTVLVSFCFYREQQPCFCYTLNWMEPGSPLEISCILTFPLPPSHGKLFGERQWMCFFFNVYEVLKIFQTA